ncbi:hypothetical protein Droror1_Dr00016518, partial [Drosera rotundifolia]
MGGGGDGGYGGEEEGKRRRLRRLGWRGEGGADARSSLSWVFAIALRRLKHIPQRPRSPLGL